MPVILEADAAAHACPWNDFTPCLGAKCMAWARHGRDHEYTETDNLQDTPEGLRPIGEPAEMPTAEGWEKDGPEFPKGYHQSSKLNLPRARAQKWIRRIAVDRGHCARAGHGDCHMPW